jgi:hypothetical protein
MLLLANSNKLPARAIPTVHPKPNDTSSIAVTMSLRQSSSVAMMSQNGEP